MSNDSNSDKSRKNVCIILIVFIFIVALTTIILTFIKPKNLFTLNEVIVTSKNELFSDIIKNDKIKSINNQLSTNIKDKIKKFDFSDFNKNPENIDLMVLNKYNGIPKDYNVDIKEKQGFIFNSTGLDMFVKMISDARQQGIDLIINSSYRSVENQQQIFDNDVNKYISQGFSKEIAIDKTSVFIQKPAHSEHNFGISADIVCTQYPFVEQDFENTEAFNWLNNNAQNYGFILRYPKNKQDITLIGYEPWHYRYVGIQNAIKIKKSGLCLEEYVYNLINNN